MKKLLVAVAAVAAAVAVPAVALAAGSSGSGATPINCQSQAWTTVPVTSSTAAWSTLSALTVDVSAIYPIEITLSGNVTGQPVVFAIKDSWAGSATDIRPGSASFEPLAGGSSFSFTWVDPNQGAALRGHELSVLWRRNSTTASSTVVNADIAVSYQDDICPGTN